jgi:hypothetical protein
VKKETTYEEPAYMPPPSYTPREPEKVEITQRHNGPTEVLIKDGRVTVNDEEVGRLTDGQRDCIRIRINNPQPEIKYVEKVEKKVCKTSCKRTCNHSRSCGNRCGIRTWKCKGRACPGSEERRELFKDNRWRP